MTTRGWWTFENTFAASVGIMLAVVLGASFFVRRGSEHGSDLIPAATLERMRKAPIQALAAAQPAPVEVEEAADEADDVEDSAD